MRLRTWVVLPTFNEAENIGRLLDDWQARLQQANVPH